MSLSIQLGNFLFKRCFVLYKPLYGLFKRRQDAFEIGLLQKYLSEGAQVLDVGANIGFYATILSGLVGKSGKVHCFEPDTTNFAHLQKTVTGIPNIITNNKAVGPRTELLKIYTSPSLNVDHRTYEPEKYDAVIEVQAVSVDDYVRSLAITKIDLIKMDIQGFEMQALQGMRETLDKNKKVVLISEFWPYGLKKAGSSLSAYYNALCEEGFICYLLDKSTLQKLTDQKVQTLEPLGEEHYFNILATRGNV